MSQEGLGLSGSGRPRKSRTTWRQGDHLVDFQFQKPPDQTTLHQPSASSRPRRKKGAPLSTWCSWYSTRTRWLQGSGCRIIVRESFGDTVKAAFFDPDAEVDWGDVRRIEIQTEERYTCPICLDEELCVPRITQCGHVFCLPCIMRYFALAMDEDRKGITRRCPLCNENTAESELRSVRLQLVDPISDGSRVHFVLCCRPPDFMLPRLARNRFEVGPRTHDIHGQPPVAGESAYQFSKIAVLPDVNHCGDLLSELEALDAAAARNWDDPETLPFIACGREHVEGELAASRCSDGAARMQPSLEIYVTPTWPVPLQCPAPVSPRHRSAVSSAKEDLGMASARLTEDANREAREEWEEEDVVASPSSPVECELRGDDHRHPFASDGNVYFFQDWSGQPVFLDPFILRLLVFQAGHDFVKLPSVLEVQVLSRTVFTVDDDNRRRCRALTHLSLGSSVTFVDVRPRELRLEVETYQVFDQQLRARARQYAVQRRRDRETEMLLKAKSDEDAEEHMARLKAMSERYTGPIYNDRLPTDDDFVPLSAAMAASRSGKLRGRRGDLESAEEGLIAQAIHASLSGGGGEMPDGDSAGVALDMSWAAKVKETPVEDPRGRFPSLANASGLHSLAAAGSTSLRKQSGDSSGPASDDVQPRNKSRRAKKGQTFKLFG